MSDLTDHVVGRYLDQHPEQGKAYALDPVTHHDVEVMRWTRPSAPWPARACRRRRAAAS
ncbi:hypothetical protein ACWGQ5_47240 [Streptomyces sp. NPDC055722]